MRSIASFCAFAALLTLASASFADDAQDHFNKGTKFYNVQDWPNALKEYREAYEIDPKPEFLWSIAQTQRLSGDCRSATLTYKAYARTASAAGANAAQEFIKKCDADTAEQERAAAATPPPPQQATPPPPQQKQVAAPPAKEEKKEPGPWVLDPLGDGLFILGIGGLTVGTVFLVLGDKAMSDTAHDPTYQQYEKDVSSARTKQTIGIIALAGGAVFTGLSVWRFSAVGSRNAREKIEQGAHLTVLPAPGGGFVTYQARF